MLLLFVTFRKLYDAVSQFYLPPQYRLLRHAGLRSRCSCGCHQLDSILGGQECKSFGLEVSSLLLKKVTPAVILLQIVIVSS